MRFEVLGEHGAAPLGGGCPAYVVSTETTTILLDCGPGTVERLWRRGLLGRLDAIVISHPHMDHCLDLLPLSGTVVQPYYRPRLPVHLPAGVSERVLLHLDLAFDAERRFATAFDVRFHTRDDTLAIGDLTVTFAPTDHPQPCFAMRVTDGTHTLVYGADGAPSEELADLAAGADLAVLEATFAADEDSAARHRHSTAAQSVALARAAGVEQVVLTHLIPGETTAAPDGAVLAHDGLAIELTRAASRQ